MVEYCNTACNLQYYILQLDVIIKLSMKRLVFSDEPNQIFAWELLEIESQSNNNFFIDY